MTHLSELNLRRLFAGEAVDPALLQHRDGCEQCKARLDAIATEQQRFEAEIPFERFAAGVERAARVPRHVERPHRRQWKAIGLALAASLLAVVAVPMLVKDPHAGNRIKGSGSGIEVVVAPAGTGAQRSASADPATPEALAAGERVRIGYRAGRHTHLLAVSVDESGAVSPIYSAGERSLPVRANPSGTDYLPDSLVFTGTGLERVVVLLSDEPLTMEEVKKALQVRYEEARGNLAQLQPLDLPGDQFHRTFLKP